VAEEITKEELKAFTEAHSAQAVALNDVLALVETNGIKLDKLGNQLIEVKEEIIGDVVGSGDEKTTLNAIKKDTSNMCGDTKMSKYFIGIVALVTSVCMVLSFIILKVGGSQTKIAQELVDIQKGDKSE
jgi:hypothetical protein